MWRYEVQYRQNGILKHRGFGYRDQFEAFIARALRSRTIKLIRAYDNEKGYINY